MSDYSVRSRLLVTVWSPPLRVVQKHVITIWNLHGGTLALVARRPVSEIEHLTMAQMTATFIPFALSQTSREARPSQILTVVNAASLSVF